MGILDDMGVSKLSAKGFFFYLKWTTAQLFSTLKKINVIKSEWFLQIRVMMLKKLCL